MRQHLIRVRSYSKYVGSRLVEVGFEAILSAGRVIENIKESGKRTQQAKEGK